MNLDIIARKLEAVKANNGGVTPYGAIRDIVKAMKPTLPWLSTEMVRFHMRKLGKGKNALTTLPPQVDGGTGSSWNNDSAISSLTSNSASPDAGRDLQTEEIEFCTNGRTNRSAIEDYTAAVDSTDINILGGRPRGSTNCSIRDVNQRIRLAKAEAAKAYRKARDEKKGSEHSMNGHHVRLSRGELRSIIKDAKTKHQINDDVYISESTIRSRHKRKKLDPPTTQGTPSPMAAFEPYLVEIIVQLARMRCPITVGTGLHLANSLIEGTTIARDLAEWKLKHNIQTRTAVSSTASSNSWAADSSVVALSSIDDEVTLNSGITFPLAPNEEAAHAIGQMLLDERPACQLSRTPPERLGLGYWNSFMRRNQHIIRSKRCVKFEIKRAEWCTYANFLVMYNEVYKAMAETGIASKLDKKVMLDKSGEIVEHKTEAFGLPTEYMMRRPDKLVFVDEVGSNTSTTKDGNVGGEKFLCEAAGRPQIKAATKDSHFTVMGFTAATGEPVMCAIIFEAMKMCRSWVLGFNGSAPLIGEENDLRHNSGGINKRYPQGPVCRFRGKDVPTFCCCSENGSITADLLVDMLKVMDKMELFDRSDGVPPFLLLDGHGSRFDLKFLRYVNNPTTKWNACVGVPYGTSYWQVGDSTEQNGCFKMALTRYKRELLARKELAQADFSIDKKDVVYLVAQAWADSFARVRPNLKAIAERGWGPSNYNCLLHPEIAATQQQSHTEHGDKDNTTSSSETAVSASQSVSIAEQLNLSRGLAGTIMTSLLEYKVRDDARNGINFEENMRKRVETAQETIRARTKRYGAGLHVSAQRFMLGPEVLDDMEEGEELKQSKQLTQFQNRLQAFRSNCSKVSEIRALELSNEKLTVLQLKVMVNWYKRPGDLPVPSTRHLLIERLNSTCTRPDLDEPTAPQAV